MLIGESLSKVIDKALEEDYEDEHRDYIGASSIGNPCARAIWYAYKGVEKKPYSAKQIRTFEMGKLLETLIIRQFGATGFRWPPLIKAYKDKEIEAFKGTPDFILFIQNKKIIIEIKTTNDSNFQTFVKKGLKNWSMQYYSQLQAYMGFSNGEVTGSYLLALNKNTSELHDEYVEFNEIFYEELKLKAKMISEATEPPERINKQPIFYLCSMCQYKEVCHGQ